MSTIERENARAEYERGWLEGAVADRLQVVAAIRRCVATPLFEFMEMLPLPEPPKEEPKRKEAEPNV